MAAVRVSAAQRVGTVGRPAQDNRRFVDGVLWVILSGMHRADLPERYGKYKSVHRRFVRWAPAGVSDQLFDDLVADQKNPYLTCWAPPSFGPSSEQQPAAKKWRRQGSGAFLMVTKYQDPPAGQRPGRAGRLWADRRPDLRIRRSLPLWPEVSRSRAGRSLRRFQRHRRGHRSDGSQSRHPL